MHMLLSVGAWHLWGKNARVTRLLYLMEIQGNGKHHLHPIENYWKVRRMHDVNKITVAYIDLAFLNDFLAAF